MHSSLRSSCIMLHEPTEIHALTYTSWLESLPLFVQVYYFWPIKDSK